MMENASASVKDWWSQALRIAFLLVPCYLLLLAIGVFSELQRQRTLIGERNRTLGLQAQAQSDLEERTLAALQREVEHQLPTMRSRRPSLPDDLLQLSGSLQALYLLDDHFQLLPLYLQTGNRLALPPKLRFDWLPLPMRQAVLMEPSKPRRDIWAGEHHELLRLKYLPLSKPGLALLAVQDMRPYAASITTLLPPAYELQLTLSNHDRVVKPFDVSGFTLYDFADTPRTDDQLPFSMGQIQDADGQYLLANSDIYFIEHLQLASYRFGANDYITIYHTDWLSLLEQWPERALYLKIAPLLLLSLLLLLATRQYQRQVTHQRLRQRQRLLEHAFEGPSGCLILDRQMRLLQINRSAKRIWHLDGRKPPRQPRRLLSDNIALWYPLLKTAYRGKTGMTETHLRLPAGREQHVEIRISPLAPEMDYQDGLVVYLNDVTRQRRQLQQLQLRAAAFQTHAMVAIADTEANIIDANVAFCWETGFSREELCGRSLFSLFSHHHSENYQQMVKRSVTLMGYWQGEVYTQCKRGEQLYELRTINTVFDDKGSPSHYVSIGTTVNRRRRRSAPDPTR